MSYRGTDEEIEARVAEQAEEARTRRDRAGEGPVSFGVAAYVARGVCPNGYATEDGTYTGAPTGDPWFLMAICSDVQLYAGRLYLISGLVEVQPIAAGTADFRVEVGRDMSLGGESVGSGVVTHTMAASWTDRFVATSHERVADPHQWYAPAADELVTFGLVVESGLEPTGNGRATLSITDQGRST